METTSYHHVCTEGLDNCDLFIDREDFAMGFNKLAIAFKLGPYPVEIASATRDGKSYSPLARWNRKLYLL
jgi:hypothetical protein